jgi:uncharacterized protein
MGEVRTWYACQRCAACCKWPGDVVLETGEVEAIAAHLEMPLTVFLEKFTRLRANRKGLSLIDQPDGACIFLKENRCEINPVKPLQCRNFPNKWRFPGWREVCEAVPMDIPADDPRFR